MFFEGKKLPRATSRESLRLTVEEGLDSSCQEIVYQTIQRYAPVCDSEIASYSGLNINNVTARRNELVDNGLVKADHVEENTKTRRQVTYWCLGKQEQPLETFLTETQVNHILDKIPSCTVYQAILIRDACDCVIASSKKHPKQTTITSREV